MNEEIPPQVEQVEQVLKGSQESQGTRDDQILIVEGGNDIPVTPPGITDGDIKEALLLLARDLTTHVNMVLSLE